MRVLQANKFFYLRGGAEKVFFDTIAGLRSRGHEVVEFSMLNPKNMPSDYSAYFISAIPELSGAHSLRESCKIFRHLFRSAEVEKKLRALSLSSEPEVAHLHNVYHHLSASTFIILKKLRIPIALTVHDVFPLCPNHSMVCKNTLCERCYRHKYYHCVLHKCINGKFLPSLAGALEAYYYWLRGIWTMVDVFICPSEFMRDIMVRWGFPADKMRLARNPFVLPEQAAPLGDSILYLGRIHPEKGVRTFMQAASNWRKYRVVLAGDGPDDPWVSDYIRQHGLNNVERLGWVGGEKREEAMRAARVVVVPSVFYENCSVTILEAMARGRIVVASRRGGNPELVKDRVTGYLFEPEDVDSLTRAVEEAMNAAAEQTAEIIKNARTLIKTEHDPDTYLATLEKIYSEVKKK